MDRTREFEQKCLLIAGPIDRFNQAAAAYGQKSSGAGCRMAVLCALPCSLYILLYPVLLLSPILGLSSVWRFLHWVIYVPIILTCLTTISVFGREKKRMKFIRKQHLEIFRNRSMGILYPCCVYQYMKAPKELRELQKVREGPRGAASGNRILRDFMDRTILPRGEITYMGEMHRRYEGRKTLILYELAVDIPARRGRKGWRNEFYGIAGVLVGWDSREAAGYRRKLEEIGNKIVFGAYKGGYAFSIGGISFDQFMHHRYGASDYSLNNPYTYRPLERREMERNYEYMCQITEM